MIPTPLIVDISEHQKPSNINYDLFAKNVAGVIVRIQYGSLYEDIHYKTHISELQKRGVPVAVYAWVRGTSLSDMETEATDFYNRARQFNPNFWWLDVEERSMSDMRNGCERFRAKLKTLGAKKVGCYIANHLYSDFNLDTSKFDAIWIPTYGVNDGQYNGSNPTATSNYQLHQYTSEGRIQGYAYSLDLNRIVNTSFEFLFNSKVNEGSEKELATINTAVDGVILRKTPSVSGEVIAKLPKNSQIIISNIVNADGFLWGVQNRSDGSKGYVDFGKSVSWVNIK